MYIHVSPCLYFHVIYSLKNVTELLLYDNMLESLPASLFHMKSLEMLNIDRNHLAEIPDTVRRKGRAG